MEQPSTEEENHSSEEQSVTPAENLPPIETSVPKISIEQNGDVNDKELSPNNHRRGTTIDFHDLSSINNKPGKMYRSQSVSVNRRSLDGLSEERETTQFPNGINEQPVRLRVRVNGNHVRQVTSRGFVETQTRLESVKSVVSKFGGSVDWSSQRINVPQKTQDQQGSVTRMAMAEVSKVRREVSQYKMKSETIEVSRAELLKELENTKRRMVRLKSDLDKAEAEEAKVKEELNRAKHYSEIAEIFVQEGSKAEKLNTIKTRQEAAVSELNSVKEEIKSLKEECVNLVKEKETLVAKAEEAVLASKKAEKMVEELTEELDNARKSLEVATAAKLEAEHKVTISRAKDEECLMWENEKKEAEEELRQLSMQIASAKEVEGKLEEATGLLENLNAELEVYIEKLNGENEGIDSEEAEKKRQEILESTRKELEEVKAKIEKVQGDVDDVHVEISSLKTEIEKEKTELSNLKQREELASFAISSIKTEIEKTKEQIEACIEKEKEAERKIVELPNLIDEATLEAGRSKSVARDAEDELNKARAEAEPVQISLKTTEMKISATMKEIEASKMSENIALAAFKALQESEMDTSSEKVTISFDEYFGLSKQGHEAAEQAHERVEAASAQMESAKELVTNSLSALYRVYSELEEKKKALHEAKQKASRAAQSKMDAEQEVKHWKSKSEEQQNSVELEKDEVAKPADEANIKSTTPDEVVKPAHEANIEVTATDMAPNGTTKAEEDNKEEVKEAVNGKPNKALEKSNLEDSFDRSNGCCLSGRSFRSEDGETTGYSSPGSPVVIEGKEKKKKRSFFRKFWAKKKAQAVAT